MKHLSLVVFLFVLLSQAFFASNANAKDVYFDSKWTLWQNADVLIWTPDKEPSIDPKEFCLSLRRYNSGIGEPKCRLFGEWERDTVAMRYATWLSDNIEPGLDAHYQYEPFSDENISLAFIIGTRAQWCPFAFLNTNDNFEIKQLISIRPYAGISIRFDTSRNNYVMNGPGF